MVDIQQNLNVPCFYHVPKNAGTFAMSLIFLYLRIFRLEKHPIGTLGGIEPTRNIAIRNAQNLELARILGYDPNNYCASADDFVKGDLNDDTHYYIDVEKITNEHLNSFNVFTLILEADGFLHHNHILSKFQKYNLKKFIILRDPIKRMFSFFNYINSDSAKHEPTYRIIPNNLSEYIQSIYLEDSWLIRQFANINDNEGITDNHYDVAYNELKNFDIADVKNTETLIEDVYGKYLNLELSSNDRKFLSKDLVHNASKKNNHVLSNDEIEIVNERMKYEIKLYNNLVKC